MSATPQKIGAVRRGKRPAVLATSIAALLALCVVPPRARGQTWQQNPGSSDWNTAANWNPTTVPNSPSATAIFDISNVLDPALSASAQVGAITFTGNAIPAYTITISPSATLNLSGTGIMNDSGFTQNFVTSAANSNGDFGTLEFTNSASAGSLTQITNNGATYFTGTADGGTAQVTTNGNGVFDISGLTDGGMNIGSIAGDGEYKLGANTLTVGGNNLSTTLLALVVGQGGSLVKTGTGTLNFTGTGEYTGTTMINSGTLLVSGFMESSAPVTVNNGATLGGSGTIEAPVTVNSGGTLTHSGNGNTATLIVGGLTLNSGATVDYQLGVPNAGTNGLNDLTTVNGNLTLGGALNITAMAGFGVGTYELFHYTGMLLGGTLTLGTLPTGYVASDFTLQTSVANEVNLVVTTAPLEYWNGAVTTANNLVNGGSGTWDNVTTNWTNSSGSVAMPWTPSVAVFSTGSGTVTVGDNITAGEVRFVPGSGAYNVSVSPTYTLTISAAGVTNTSGSLQNFVTAVDGNGNFGTITFTNDASAGVNTQFTNAGAIVGGGFGGLLTVLPWLTIVALPAFDVF